MTAVGAWWSAGRTLRISDKSTPHRQPILLTAVQLAGRHLPDLAQLRTLILALVSFFFICRGMWLVAEWAGYISVGLAGLVIEYLWTSSDSP